MQCRLPTSCARLAAATLALAAACQSTRDQDPLEDRSGHLCAVCAPRAGGETSDFGNACFADCGEIEQPRPLTEAEANTFALDRALALVRDGVMLPIGWLPSREAGGLSRTQPSVLYVRLQRTAEPQITLTQHCGITIFLPVLAELETGDGALQAVVSGSIFSRGDRLWEADLGADLADVRGSVDLRMAEAWSEIEGAGQREGELYASLVVDETLVYGSIGFSVGYERYPAGLSSLLGEHPRVAAPISGRFPLNRCTPEGATPIEPDAPLPEAAGESAAALAQQAYAFLSQRCSDRWQALWRDTKPAEVTLQLDRVPALDVCLRRYHDAISLSWAATGSVGSADGRLRTEIRRAAAIVHGGAVIEVSVEGGVSGAGVPLGTMRCILGEDEVSWSGDVRIPRQDGARACLATEGYDCTN